MNLTFTALCINFIIDLIWFLKQLKTSSFNIKIFKYNTRHKRDFHAVPINTTTYGKRTMAYKGRHLWNQLPKDLKETDDTLLFKTKLKDQFFKMYN